MNSNKIFKKKLELTINMLQVLFCCQISFKKKYFLLCFIWFLESTDKKNTKKIDFLMFVLIKENTKSNKI